jgi:CelD/BcsL family acetyltransferase involved in cellulose biosynthesis
MRLLAEPPLRRGVPVPRPLSTRTAFAPLDRDWAAFEARMSSGSRADIRRKRRGLEKQAPVSFEALAPDEDAFEAPLAELFKVEAAGWKSRSGTAIVQDAAMARFYTEYGRLAARRGMLRLFFLRAGAETVAAQMHVEFADRLWSLRIGFDERWSKFSPGRVLTHDILRWASGRGLRALEHLGVAETWQRRWPIEIRQHSTLRYYPASPRGGLAFAVDSFGFVGRRLNGEAKRDGARFIPAGGMTEMGAAA